ncbi:MAG: MmcQ/YjbR family DNA-binding protein [Fimbriimonadales bacterium]
MANRDDVQRIALSLPGAIESPDGLAYSVPVKGKEKGFVWAWAERVHPKKARVRNPGVLAVRVPSLSAKEMLLGSDAEKYFTEAHYDGFSAVLVRLDAIESSELEDLIVEAWRCEAPKDLVREFDKE